MEGAVKALPNLAELLGKGLLDKIFNSGYSVTDIENKWQRMGGETYIIKATLKKDEVLFPVVIKACIKMFPSKTILEWIERRKRIEMAGISTPKLYLVPEDEGILIEEDIPYDLRQVYAQSDEQGKQMLYKKVSNDIEKILELGFQPISFHDLRSRGNDVVFIDFGSDMGGWQDGKEKSANNKEAVDLLLKNIF